MLNFIKPDGKFEYFIMAKKDISEFKLIIWDYAYDSWKTDSFVSICECFPLKYYILYIYDIRIFGFKLKSEKLNVS